MWMYMVYSASLRALRLFLGFWIDREAGDSFGGCLCLGVYWWWCIFQGRILEVELLNQNKYICSFVKYC